MLDYGDRVVGYPLTVTSVRVLVRAVQRNGLSASGLSQRIRYHSKELSSQGSEAADYDNATPAE
jgi:hypothetical protein